MALDERARHELFLGLEEALGPERAETLMELMPPVGWADVATKRDLDALEERVHLRFELVEQRFELVDRRFEALDQRLEGLDQRFEGLDQRFEASEHKVLAGFRGELLAQTNVLTAQMNGMTAQMRMLILAIVGCMVSVAALVVGALRLG